MPTADPLNLYRLIEAGEVDMIEAEEPEPDLDGSLEPVFGCQPWSRERSQHPDRKSSFPGAKRTLVGIGPDGSEVVVTVCDVCGSGHKEDGRDRLVPSQFCAACERSLRDQDVRWLRGDYRAG